MQTDYPSLSNLWDSTTQTIRPALIDFLKTDYAGATYRFLNTTADCWKVVGPLSARQTKTNGNSETYPYQFGLDEFLRFAELLVQDDPNTVRRAQGRQVCLQQLRVGRLELWPRVGEAARTFPPPMTSPSSPIVSRLSARPGSSRPLRRVWELGFNTCHAPIVMRSDVQAHMRRAKDELGMAYWRCHGTLSDDVGVVFTDRDGSRHYCFSGLRRIIDAALAAGVRPFMELSFMPAALASNPAERICHYAGVTSPPVRYEDWAALVGKTVAFLVNTYGVEEVAGWWFEVWNEPNIPFWTGDQQGYFQLYRSAALAIKAVDPRLRVGGPATARAAWVADLLAWCRRTATPLDFISTHIYPSDVPFMEEAYGDVKLLGMDFIHGHFRRVREEAQAVGFNGPIIWGEWNSSAGPFAVNHDDCNNAAFVAGALAGIEAWGDGSLYWNLTDIYEESEYHFAPFHGGYGLYTVDGVAKSAARVFGFFKHLLARRVELDGLPAEAARGAILTTDETGRKFAIVLWNHLRDDEDRSGPWEVEIDLGRVAISRAEHSEIIPGSGSAYEAWIAQGRPMTLSHGQLGELRAASEPACRMEILPEAASVIRCVVRPGTARLIELA